MLSAGGAWALAGPAVSSASLARYVVRAGEETGYSPKRAPTFYGSAAEWTAGNSTAAVDAKRLRGEGFRGALTQSMAGAHGAQGISIVIALASPTAARSEEQSQLKEDIADQSPSPVTRFTIKQLPTSTAFTAKGDGGVAANVLFVEGSCVLLVGDFTATNLNPRPPITAGALKIYARTAHSGGVCT
jgi:hypothetical protein